jgi:RNA polymerase sigma-70 factor (ECF subfamily)
LIRTFPSPGARPLPLARRLSVASAVASASASVNDDATAHEAVILAGLREGRLEALAWAFDRWQQRVRVLARRLLSDDAAAEDLVQDVFASLPRAARRFRGDVTLEIFLLAIAVKRARSHRRAALRRRRALEGLRADDTDLRANPERDAYRNQLGRRLAVALDRLPLRQRAAFVVCEVEELTSVEAARVLGAPDATIRTRLFHARRRLRQLLGAEIDE